MLKPLIRFLSGKSKSYSKINQLRYLSQSALIEETKAPYMTRVTLVLVSFVIILLIIWAGITEVKEVAVTQGEVLPIRHIQRIQHLEGGVISKINAKEGELVKKGDTILVLDGASIKQDLSALRTKKISLEYQSLRLKSFISNTRPNFKKIVGYDHDSELEEEQIQAFDGMIEARDTEKKVLTDQITQKKETLTSLMNRKMTLTKNIKLVKEERDLKQKLHKKGHLSKFKFLAAQKHFNDIIGRLKKTESDIAQAKNMVSEYKNRVESLEARLIDDAHDELSQVEGDISQLDENITKFEQRITRLVIKSPSYGYIKVLNIKTIGGVIETGEVLAEIVPLRGGLVVEVRINPKDAGHIQTGQAVNVKISSYDFSRYGTLDGKLEYISATTFAADDGSRYYTGRVSIAKNYIGSNPKRNIIIPGMTAQADIVTGSKSILIYLLKPIAVSIQTSFSER
ncbi:MAG: secretion protein HlyD [Rickettsiales bacterium]|nr:MAG: secretion protein HlyD [Rickettsiales bacterium]